VGDHNNAYYQMTLHALTHSSDASSTHTCVWKQQLGSLAELCLEVVA